MTKDEWLELNGEIVVEARAERDAAIARAEAAEARLAASACWNCKGRGTYGDGADVPGCTWCGNLTPDEVRVIAGLVRAMREAGAGVTGDTRWTQRSRAAAIVPTIDCMHLNRATSGQMAHAAWHIAHAISQMAGDEDASRVLGERGW